MKKKQPTNRKNKKNNKNKTTKHKAEFQATEG